MLGALFTEQEIQELEYLMKKEMEELLLDLEDERISEMVKQSMEERYRMIFQLFTRFAPSAECGRYVLPSRRKGSV